MLTYRVRYVQRPEWHSVIDLILFDDRNPRSAHFQTSKLAKHVRLLPDAPLGDLVAELDRIVTNCRSIDTGSDIVGRARTLAPFLENVDHVADRLSDTLTLRYFSHVDDVPRATVAV